ncbi:alcohol dehydrogenase, iron-containing family protein [Tritrichomonas foetus]|uniref:Alcohol dehydrogenase, iron-containing family protein n=1 Tax=Tritrichomonas foetus TaxID=1144522 RepID=A0A1J4JKU6_9EUKA|nr:alcohol dehydrogenase, iron-containing family protein [Tritrichomonas foetus]|eukprot:OHS99734.1 alcohol dehydrogenase, iron-containing family protein [Tritrichomonas foetus]
MSTQWVWNNTTQVCFGENAVKEHMKTFVQPRTRVLCTFGGGSINANGCRADVQAALDELGCEVKWEGGICPNPQYDRLYEIIQSAKEYRPDLLISVGGGSICDATKFISLAVKLEEGQDPWNIVIKKQFPASSMPFGAVMTLPATGSEWNCGFVISRASEKLKLAVSSPLCYPKWSLLDPRYTMSLPVRQLRNGVYDALIHCIDRFITPQIVPMFDNFWMSVMKELIEIGPDVIKPDSPIELRERLIVAALFAINGIFSLEKELDRGVHIIGHMLTVKYGIDHAASLSIVIKPFLENQISKKVTEMAKTAEFVFGVREGTEEDKARIFIDRFVQFTKDLGMPMKVSDWEGAVIGENDVEELVKLVMNTTGGLSFGFRNSMITEDDTRSIFKQSVY